MGSYVDNLKVKTHIPYKMAKNQTYIEKIFTILEQRKYATLPQIHTSLKIADNLNNKTALEMVLNWTTGAKIFNRELPSQYQKLNLDERTKKDLYFYSINYEKEVIKTEEEDVQPKREIMTRQRTARILR